MQSLLGDVSLFVVSQAFINMLANRATVLVRGCVGYHFDGLLSQLLWWVHTIAEVCNFPKVAYLGNFLI